jgi:hypothetical protein
MFETVFMQSQLEYHDEKIHEVSDELTEFKITVNTLVEKHLILIEKLDTLMEMMSRTDDRLLKLEEFTLLHLARTAFIKSTLKYWPVFLATLFFCFSMGVMVDNQKVADAIVNKIQWKKSS